MPLSISIDVQTPSLARRMRSRVDQAGTWLVALVAGTKLPSYTQTREEMGGVPWRRLVHSDAWFVSQVGLPASTLAEQITVADDAPDLRTPLFSRRTLAVGGGLLALALGSVLIVSRGAPSASSLSPTAAASVAPATPTPDAPTPAPERVIAAASAPTVAPVRNQAAPHKIRAVRIAKHKLARARTRAHRG